MTKKTFMGQENPAEMFISIPEQGRAEPAQDEGLPPATEIPKGFKPDPRFIETKNRRVQVLMQPSLHEALKAQAKAEGRSVNELIHSLLMAGVKKGEPGHE